MRAMRIGVTGKLGSGKSLLMRAIEARGGFYCVYSDDLARELMEREPALREQLTQLLGPQTYSNGALDRKFVASKIFSDHELLKQVEAAVHPATTGEIERIFKTHPDEAVVVESALILQSPFQEAFDYIVLVEAPDDAAVERVAGEGRMERSDAAQRLSEQSMPAIDRGEADFILDNGGTLEAFREKCERLIDILEALKYRPLPEEPLHE